MCNGRTKERRGEMEEFCYKDKNLNQHLKKYHMFVCVCI